MWITIAYLTTYLLGVGGVERLADTWWPAATALEPVGVLIFAAWLVWHAARTEPWPSEMFSQLYRRKRDLPSATTSPHNEPAQKNRGQPSFPTADRGGSRSSLFPVPGKPLPRLLRLQHHEQVAVAGVNLEHHARLRRFVLHRRLEFLHVLHRSMADFADQHSRLSRFSASRASGSTSRTTTPWLPLNALASSPVMSPTTNPNSLTL